jgi:aminoglycoside phosphotransferase (APT) family kinase protein
MPDLTFVKAIARTLYGLEAESIATLELHSVEGRGIYRVQETAGGAWVMRMKGLDELHALGQAAMLLEWLGTQHYPAPRVRRTVTGERVTSAALPHDEHARCHPAKIATTVHQLTAYGGRIPPAFSRLVAELRASMALLLQHTGDRPLCLTHGDCWYQNAIQGSDGGVTLIDWDNVGVGLPLLDLGGMLLTAHFDLRWPLVLEPSAAKIAAIVQGYQQIRPITAQEQALLAESMRFLLAVQLGSYLANETLVAHPEFPFVLQKLQARHDTTRPIADIASSSGVRGRAIQ